MTSTSWKALPNSRLRTIISLLVAPPNISSSPWMMYDITNWWQHLKISLLLKEEDKHGSIYIVIVSFLTHYNRITILSGKKNTRFSLPFPKNACGCVKLCYGKDCWKSDCLGLGAAFHHQCECFYQMVVPCTQEEADTRIYLYALLLLALMDTCHLVIHTSNPMWRCLMFLLLWPNTINCWTSDYIWNKALLSVI